MYAHNLIHDYPDAPDPLQAYLTDCNLEWRTHAACARPEVFVEAEIEAFAHKNRPRIIPYTGLPRKSSRVRTLSESAVKTLYAKYANERERLSVFYPDKGTNCSIPTYVCAQCPVQSECRSWIDETEQDIGENFMTGWFGGASVHTRIADRRARIVEAEREARYSTKQDQYSCEKREAQLV